jgi:hypothetical protein
MRFVSAQPTSREQAAFARFVGTWSASAAGDALVAVALSGTLFFGLEVSQARSRLGLYLLLTMAPYALLSPVVGPFLDRRRGYHRLAVIGAAGGRAVICVLMASAFTTLGLYPLAFAILVLSRAASVARAALVPTLVPDRRLLVAANARLAKAAVMTGMAASIPGVIALKIGSPAPVLILAAAAYALSAFTGVALPAPQASPADDAPCPAARLTPAILRAARVQTIVRGLAGFLLFLIAFGLKRSGASDAGFGLVLACAGAGGFTGAVVLPRLRRSGNEEWIMMTALFVGAGASLIAGNSFGLDLAAVLAGAVGVVGSATRLAFDAVVQREAPEAARGRVFARFETTFQLAWVIGAALPVAFAIGIQPGLVAATVAYAIAALMFLAGLGPAGRRRLVEPAKPRDPSP